MLERGNKQFLNDSEKISGGIGLFPSEKKLLKDAGIEFKPSGKRSGIMKDYNILDVNGKNISFWDEKQILQLLKRIEKSKDGQSNGLYMQLLGHLNGPKFGE